MMVCRRFSWRHSGKHGRAIFLGAGRKPLSKSSSLAWSRRHDEQQQVSARPPTCNIVRGLSPLLEPTLARTSTSAITYTCYNYGHVFLYVSIILQEPPLLQTNCQSQEKSIHCTVCHFRIPPHFEKREKKMAKNLTNKRTEERRKNKRVIGFKNKSQHSFQDP